MKRVERFKFLQIFGDGKAHNWFEIIFLGVQFLKVKQSDFERLFKTCLAYGLVLQKDTQLTLQIRNQRNYMIDWRDYEFQISPTGDAILRDEQIARSGDSSYYNTFDRTLTGPNGLDKFAPLPKGYKPIQG